MIKTGTSRAEEFNRAGTPPVERGDLSMRNSPSTIVMLAAAVILCSALPGGLAANRDRFAGARGDREAYTTVPVARGAA